MKIAYWDIETWDLSAPFGPLLCASVLCLEPGYEDRMITLRQDQYVKDGLAADMLDDKQLCIDLRDFLEEHHLHAGWFSKGFDISHLNSRLMLHGERRLKEMLHMDCIWYYKGWRGIKFQTSKMKHVAEALGLERKPDVEATTWMEARAGRKRAMDEVCDRCEADVRITRAITEMTLENDLVKNITRY